MESLAEQVLIDIQELTGVTLLDEDKDRNEILIRCLSDRLDEKFKHKYINMINIYKKETQNLTDFVQSQIMVAGDSPANYIDF